MPIATRSLAILASTAILIGFIGLLLHNQSQTEYLISYDFWRNYNVLAGNGTFNEYLFHNVHTYAIPSMFWYFDVLLSGGSLKLFHAIVVGKTVAAFGCLIYLSLRLFEATRVHTAYAVAIATAAMALWLSPSNSAGLTYPLVDILATCLLLSLCLSAVILAPLPAVPTIGATERLRVLGYLGVAVFGFFSLEVFVAVPLFLALDCALRNRYREILLHALIVAFLLTLYFALREGPVRHASSIEINRDYLAFAHNFLMFLAMHVLMVLRAFKVEPGLAANIAIIASALQLLALTLCAVSQYSGHRRANLSSRFALLFAVVGIISIALATWLRFSSDLTTVPVARYTPYSILFSMGVLFLSVRALAVSSGRVLRAASWLALLVISSALTADIFAFWLRFYNPGGTFALRRLEMAVYASSPGHEVGLGPSEPDAGLAFRSNLHAFLSSRELSVFGSAGYLGLGHSLPPLETGGHVRCRFLRKTSAPAARPQYALATFRTEGVSSNGVFLLADAQGTIKGFGLSAQLHPAEKTMRSLLPAAEVATSRIFYGEVEGADLVSAIPCQ